MHKTLKIYLLIVALYITSTSHAEVVLDGTLGPAGPLQGPHFAIEARLGQAKNKNLFHSFAKFNLNQAERATFYGPDTIENVISRVTGGEPSHIDGTLGSKIPNADIYFINPAGVMFGPNARLDVQGSLHVSTADYLRLGEQGHFNATSPEQSLLTVAPPSAFGFLTESPAGISKQRGFLAVPTGKTFSLIGGELTLQEGRVAVREDLVINSFIGAPSGQVNLVSVASPGEVSVSPEEMPETAFEQFGIITIADTTTGADNKKRGIANVDVSGESGGKVYIRGGRIVLDNGYVFADTLGEEDGKGITVKATNELVLAKGARITTDVFDNKQFDKMTGKAGNITITARQITLTEGSQIGSTTQTAGAAGNTTVSAQEAIDIAGHFSLSVNGQTENYNSGIFSNTIGTGKGGQITLIAPTLTVADGGDIRADTQGFGDAGDISIQVDRLILKKGGQINLSSGNRETITGTGRGGTLEIVAKESVLITGLAGKAKNSALLSNAFSVGEGGAIKVFAPKLEIQDNGTIQAGTQGEGNAGNIFLDVDKLHLHQGGFITTESKALGDAGTIHLTLDDLSLHHGAITTQADKAGGGDIFIRGNGLFDIVNSTISARAQGALPHHQGGNLTIDSPNFLILDKSQLLANAYAGNGGNIRIIAEQFIRSSESLLDASSELGLDGEIIIQSPDNDIENSLTVLPSRFLNADKLLKESCANRARPNLNLSHFFRKGRGGIRQSPENLLTHTPLQKSLGLSRH